ncbi:MAG: TonB-dependent receptor [Paludibacter sp.]|nr:TonB-dependent receptor [Paludibacter sp.]
MNEKLKFQCNLLRKIKLLAFFCSMSFALIAQTRTISGVVRSSENGETLIGATIKLKGTSTGTITDINGKFTISIPNNESVLVVSMIGLKKAEVKPGKLNVLNITLDPDQALIDEVVVTGYTSQKKADLTGAVSVVKVADMKDAPFANAAQAMQGRVAGVQINSDGAPGGGGTSIRIRGMGTVNNNNPLYIIDGIPTTENLNSLNAGDIESMQVLKDASSASIYGARAANGVIIITTKKGKTAKVSVDLDISSGVQMVAKQFDVLNSTQWGEVFWKANQNSGMTATHPFYGSGATPVAVEYLDAAHKIPFSNTNWQNEIYSPAMINKYSASISNGSEKGNMMLSLNYTDQNGLVDYTFFKRYSARLNSNYNISKYITVGENVMIANWKDLGASTQNDRGIPFTAMRENPAIPVKSIDGVYTSPMQLASSDIGNPVKMLYNARDNQNNSWRILGNAFLEVKPLKNLTLKSNLGIEHIQFLNNSLNRKQEPSDVNSMSVSYGQGDTYTWSNTANYNLKTGKHSLNVLAGTEAINYMYSGLTAFRNNYTFEDLNYMVLDAGSGTQTNGGSKSEWALFSVFGKADYNFADKYLLSATIRRDASSRLQQSNNSGIFPAFSGAWRLTEESFIPKVKNIDYIKVRGGWGQTGNSEIGNYATYSSYGYDIGNASYDLNGANTTSVTGIKVMTSGNPDLKWETTTQTNVGLDASFFNNELSLSFDYYIKNTKDMLTIPPSLSVMGENSAMWMNTGDMRNNGFELVLNYTPKKQGDFSWDGSFNISKYKNKLVRLNALVTQTGGDQRNIVGQPLGVFYGYVVDGIFQTQDQVLNHADQQGKGVGRFIYRDLDHNGVINDKDQCVIGDPNPDLSMGLNLNLNYKNLTLSCFFNSDLGFDIYNTTKRQLNFMTYGDKNTNRGKSILNAWTPENTNTDIPALTVLDNNNETRMSTYFIENGSYLKLRNLRLAYNVTSNSWTKKIGLSTMQIYGMVDNVFTISNYSGLEPALPVSGIDNAPYPIARTLMLGLNLKF